MPNLRETMLEGCRVLDLTDEKGQFAGQLLGSLGADVIKVEPPGGDPSRNIGPFAGDITDPDRSLFWLAYNTDKRSVTLDLETPAARDVFRRLAATADVVLESYPPGYLEAHGLAYDDLAGINPAVILTSITPFGSDGPYRNWACSDLVCWAAGGLLSLVGDTDRAPTHTSQVPLAYLLASMDAAWGSTMALYWQEISGEGQHVEISIQESLVRAMPAQAEAFQATGIISTRGAALRYPSGVALQGTWETRDGYVTFLIFPGVWGATHDNPPMVAWMDECGQADDYIRNLDWASLDWTHVTPAEAERIHDYFRRFFKSKTNAELLDGGHRRRTMVQPIATPGDILQNEHLRERGYWQQIEYSELGIQARYPKRPCLSSLTPCCHRRPAPRVGEHNREILADELGLSQEELKTLMLNGSVQAAAE